MNKIAQRTLCSVLFASLVTTQLSGMLSVTSKEKKKIITTIKGSPFSQKEEINEPILSIKKLTQNKSVISFNPLKNVKDKALSLIKKNKRKENNKEDESQEKKEKKEKRKKQVLVVTATGLVVGFIYKNRKKFIPEINAAELSLGWKDCQFIKIKPGKQRFFAGLININNFPKIAAKFSPDSSGSSLWGTIGMVGLVVGSWLFGKQEKGNGSGHSEYIPLPTVDQIEGFRSLLLAGGIDAARKTYDNYDVIWNAANELNIKEGLGQLPGGNIQYGYNFSSNGMPTITTPNIPTKASEVIEAVSTVINLPPSPEIPQIPKGPNINLDKQMKATQIIVAKNLTGRVTDKPSGNSLTQDDTATFWDIVNVDNAIMALGAVAEQVVYATKVRTIKELATAAWSVFDRQIQGSTADLLGIKKAPDLPHPDSSNLAKLNHVVNTVFKEGTEFAVDISKSTLDEVFSVWLKCMGWEWKSSDECYKRHPEMIRYYIKTTYKKELAQIKDIDGKIKYIKEHKIIDEGTKKASIQVLENVKEFNRQRDLDYRTLQSALNDDRLTPEEKRIQVEKFAQNGIFDFEFEEDDGKESGAPLLVSSLVKNGTLAMGKEWKGIFRSFTDEY